ncbi:MAG: hypothetical protein Q7T57_05665, partial [Dehalococcoidales bacterium]|nr:hypothetical protein [Dehalococcoidales bacterium]
MAEIKMMGKELHPEMSQEMTHLFYEQCARDIAGWYGEHGQGMQRTDLEVMAGKYFSGAGLEQFFKWLSSPEGLAEVKKWLKLEAYKRGIAGPSHLRETRVPSLALPTGEKCELVSPQYYHLMDWFNIPLPDYSFAIEPEAKERKIDEVLKKLQEGVAHIHES